MVLGKILAGLFGFIFGARFGPMMGLFGLMLGLYLGDIFDKGLRIAGSGWSIFALGSRVRETFFNATFSTMGYIAKLDGRISEDEIKTAEQIMVRLGLTPELRRRAIVCFSRGKQPNFNWQVPIDELKAVCFRFDSLLRVFIEIQMETAYAEGALSDRKRRVLAEMAKRLGISNNDFYRLDSMYQARQRFKQHRGGQNYTQQPPPVQRATLDDAYQILGVRPEASDQQVTRAYRKLMSQHHPDKLVSQGLPEEMMKLATEKTQQIKAAYDQIMSQRKIRQAR